MKILSQALALALSIPAVAQASSEINVAGWSVGPMYDNYGSCAASNSYEGKGNTNLTIVLNPELGVYIVLSNSGWSIKGGEKYELRYDLEYVEYRAVPAVGIDDGEFTSLFENSILKEISRSTYISIFNADVLIDKLSLKGSGLAIKELNSCVDSIKKSVDRLQKDRKKFDHIPDDPFSNN